MEPHCFKVWEERTVMWMWSGSLSRLQLTCKNILVSRVRSGKIKPADSSEGFQKCFALMSSKQHSISACGSAGSAGRRRQLEQRSWCLTQVPWIPFYRALEFFIDYGRNVVLIFFATTILQFQIQKSLICATVKHGIFILFFKDMISYLEKFKVKYCSLYRSTCICENMLLGIKIYKIKTLQ